MAVARWNRIIVVAVTHQRQLGDAGGDLVAGVIGRWRQRHERRRIRLHALVDRLCMAAQDRLQGHDGRNGVWPRFLRPSSDGKKIDWLHWHMQSL